MIKILHLEDVPSDAELVEWELNKGQLIYKRTVVDNKIDFEKALNSFLPDIILSDHTLPDFDSTQALQMVKDLGLDIPFIIVTATMSEEFAVEVMKLGAYDYILKDRLKRLPNAVQNAIKKNQALKDRQRFLKQIVGDDVLIKEANAKLVKTNRLYSFISQINQSIVHIKEEQELILNSCRIAIEFGKFKMAWIGMFDTNSKKIVLVGQNGMPREEIKLFNNAAYQEGGPQHQVLSTGSYYICNDIAHNLELESWKLYAAKKGIQSCMVLPIIKSGNIVGTFNLYSTELNFFDTPEIKLLVEVTGDISFALDLFEKEKQHKKAEREIETSEERYHSLFSNMREAFAYCKMIYVNGEPDDFIYIDVNDAFEKETGLKNVVGKRVSEVIPDIKTSSIELFKAYSRVASTGISERFEFYIESIKMWFDVSVYSSVKDYFTAIFEVITERKNIEMQKEFDRNNLASLINNTSDLLWSVDKNCNLITFNDPFFRVIKLTSGHELFVGDNVFSLVLSDEQSERFKIFYARALAGETFTEIEHIELPLESWSEISFYPIRKGEEIVGTACHSRDITERKKNEEELKLLTNRLVLATNSAGMGVWDWNIEKNYLEWDKGMYRLYEIDNLQFGSVYDGWLSRLHPADMQRVNEDIQLAITGEKEYDTEFKIIWGDLSVHYIKATGIVERDNSGTAKRMIGVNWDVTEGKNAEINRAKITADIVQRNKDLEQFSYIVSHNLRAPVANIIGLTEAIQNEKIEPEVRKDLMAGLSHSSKKLDEVILDLNDILQTKQEVNQKKELVRFSEIAGDIKSSIENLVKREKAVIRVDFSEIDVMLTLKGYIHSIFYNMISNSLKYHRPGIPPVIEIRSYKSGNKIILLFKDNGMGIDLAKKGDQVFGLYKRFHTETAEGKGMGLYMVKTQIESLGGKIFIESEVNKGTTFKIEFETK